MKFKAETLIRNYKDEPISRSDEDDTQITLGEILTMACVAADPTKWTTGEEKLKIYRVLQKVSVEGEIDLKAEELALVKELVGQSHSVIVVGPVWDLLDGVEAEPEQKTTE